MSREPDAPLPRRAPAPDRTRDDVALLVRLAALAAERAPFIELPPCACK